MGGSGEGGKQSSRQRAEGLEVRGWDSRGGGLFLALRDSRAGVVL